MSNTVTNSKELSAEEVCSILRVCGEAKVSVLKFRDLYVKFGGTAESQKNDVPSALPITPEAEISDNSKQVAFEAIEKEMVLTKEERLALLQIEDPLEYERLVVNGELEDLRHGDVTDEEAYNRGS